jgi:hypothetical protein
MKKDQWEGFSGMVKAKTKFFLEISSLKKPRSEKKFKPYLLAEMANFLFIFAFSSCFCLNKAV